MGSSVEIVRNRTITTLVQRPNLHVVPYVGKRTFADPTAWNAIRRADAPKPDYDRIINSTKISTLPKPKAVVVFQHHAPPRGYTPKPERPQNTALSNRKRRTTEIREKLQELRRRRKNRKLGKGEFTKQHQELVKSLKEIKIEKRR